jgi:uncharacterized repeat protein (TIGR03803 family)
MKHNRRTAAFVICTLSFVMGLVGIAQAEAPLDVLASFGADGAGNPQASLMQATDGSLYGTTPQGGAFNAGAVFKLTGGTVTVLYSFTGGTDGAYPYAGLIQGTDGNLYGTTFQGGDSNAGTVFQLTPGGTLTTLFAFTGGTDGGYPYAPLIQATNGNFYGTTLQGGASNAGTVFQLAPGSAVAVVLYAFTGGEDGAYPYAGLIQGMDGNFYGTTSQGGISAAGTVFQLTPAGTVAVVYAFTGGTDGAYPIAGVIQGTDGNLYGTTLQGGASGVGTVFQLTPAGTLTILNELTGGADGAYPIAGVIQGTDGNFYGTAYSGGVSDAGTIFQVTPAGVLTVLHSFTGGLDGAYPYGGLIQGTDGNLYGTTQSGGDSSGGTAFRFRLNSPPSPTITWHTPAPILYGTALSGAQLNAAASVPGSFAYTPAAGTVPHAGPQTLSVTFTPTDTTNYSIVTSTVTLTVLARPSVIAWAQPAPIAYGTALGPAQLNARANVRGAFAYTPSAGTVLEAGLQTLAVTFTPASTDYTTAASTVTLVVTAATPVIAWTPPAAIVSGTPLSGLQLNATANTDGTFDYSPVAGTVLGAGLQTLSVTFTPTDATNYGTAASTVTLTVASLADFTTSGGGNVHPLQFTPAAGYRGLVLAGYEVVADPAVGYAVIGNCSYYTVHSGSGRGGGYRTTTTHFDQTCRWDLYGNLLTVTPGAPAAPVPLSVSGTRTIYASNASGVYTGTDAALPLGGFVYTPGSHFAWLTSSAYMVLPQTLYTLTAILQSDGDLPLRVFSVRATALNGAATVSSTTCTGSIPVGSTCAVTVVYDPTRLRSATGLAYDTLDISVVSDTGQIHDFVQSYTIVLSPKNTTTND